MIHYLNTSIQLERGDEDLLFHLLILSANPNPSIFFGSPPISFDSDLLFQVVLKSLYNESPTTTMVKQAQTLFLNASMHLSVRSFVRPLVRLSVRPSR